MHRCLTLVLAGLVPSSAWAGWSSDPAVNTQIPTSNVAIWRSDPMLARDVDGNLLAMWNDAHLEAPSPPSLHASAGLLSAAGDPLWGPRYIARLGTVPPVAGGAVVLPGVGTAVGFWELLPPSNFARVRAFRADGSEAWQSVVTAFPGGPAGPQLGLRVTGVGQELVGAWAQAETSNIGGPYTARAQRLGSAGQREWGPGGMVLGADMAGHLAPLVVPDDTDGAIVVWTRIVAPQLFAQRLTADGLPSWAADGVPVTADSGTPSGTAAVADGAGGVIVVWLAPDGSLNAQRLGRDGTPSWGPAGVRVATGTDVQNPRVVALGGGAVVAWTERRSTDTDVYAQRLSSTGAFQWPATGLPVTAAPGDQTKPVLVADEQGGVVLGWQDHRAATWDVYAQRLRADGVALWTDSGRPVGIAANDQTDVAGLADGAGGAYFAWIDKRDDARGDLYAAHVHATGVLPVTLDAFGVE